MVGGASAPTLSCQVAAT
ncbi:DUF6053 domain-containing protein [Lysobacter enzymogenes]